MGNITNPWLNPLQRSYQQIKRRLLKSLDDIKDKEGKPLITDKSEGNIFVIIISMFSAIAEVLHYYIDNIGRESFLTTSRKYSSLIKHGALVDYHPKGAIAPSVDVIITRPLSSNGIGAKVTITKSTLFTDASGNPWLPYRDVVWLPNTPSCKVSLVQHKKVPIEELIGMVLPPVDNVVIPLPSMANGSFYEHGTMTLSIDNEVWTLVETFAYSTLSDRHFMVTIDEHQNAFIFFGDGKFGRKPEPNSKITECTVYITKGAVANIKSGSITKVPFDITSSVNDASCSNPYAAGGGSDYENFDMLRKHIPLSVKTLGVAITKQDFIDLAKQVPGVNQAALEYECGRKMNVYITPENGLIASEALRNSVYEYLKSKSPLTTWLDVKSTGVVPIILDIDVTGKKSFSSTDIYNQIVTALLNRYSVNNATIGGSVRLSDIYALLDNLSMVDYLHINKFYMKPWPVTIYGNTQLILGQYHLEKANGSMKYLITMADRTKFEIRSTIGSFITHGFVGSAIEVNDKENGFSFNLSIQGNEYESGDRYAITVSKPEFDYVEPGFNLPVFTEPNQLTIKVNETV